MFRLLKLAAVALFGYALYEFFRGMTQDPQMRAMAREAFGQGAGNGASGGEETGGLNITGPGEGVEEATFEPTGGSVRHKVGRGVVS